MLALKKLFRHNHRTRSDDKETTLGSSEDGSPNDKASKLPPLRPTNSGGSVLLRARPSFGRSDQTQKGRPLSAAPNFLSDAPKRSKSKDIPPIAEQPTVQHSGSTDVRRASEQLDSTPGNDERSPVEVEGSDENSQVTSPTQTSSDPTTCVASTAPPGRVMGREFDDDSDEDVHTRDELLNLSSLFSRAAVVMNSPERAGVFINYLFMQNMDVAPSLFYLVSCYYQHAVSSSKELTKDYKRLYCEIFSTFLHPKSPLRVTLSDSVLQEITQRFRQPGVVDQFFIPAIEPVLNMIQTQLDKLCREIQHGITTWKPQESINLLRSRNYDEKIAIFELCLTGRLQDLAQAASSEPASSQMVDATMELEKNKATVSCQATFISLVTAYRYFVIKGGIELSETGSVSRGALFARSFENLTSSALVGGIGNGTGSISGSLATAGSSLWTKSPYFCAKMKPKSHGHLLLGRKTKYVHKNHVLQERPLEEIACCSVCSEVIWCWSSQSLSCVYCDLNVHQKCRGGIKDTCTREGRKAPSAGSSPLPKQPSSESSGSQKTITGIPPTGQTSPQDAMGNTVSEMAMVQEAVVRSGSQASIPGSVNLSNKQSFSSVDSQPSRSEHSLTDDNESVTTTQRQDSVDMDSRHVLRMKHRYDITDSEAKSSLFRKESIASAHSITSQDPEKSPLATETVPELVTTNWSDDPEMIASESFEAAVELRRHFPNYQMPAKGVKSEDYIRTLCLLEFHQKTQYMVRHLKQYEYLLLKHWPPEHQVLARELCLDRIPKLIDLFRSLVACIDGTKTAQGYVGMAEAVLSWLTDNSQANLKLWAQHCQALSCTNMLDSLTKWVRDYSLRHPDIDRLLKTRHNKFVLLEGLKHLRILYFNMPLIANNIVKDLEKKTKSYKAEAKIWEQIFTHLASLPQSIDDICMPLVKKINSGQFQSSLDKKDAIFKQPNATVTPYQDLLLNFPRTLFRYWVFAHSEVAVDKLTVTSANKVNHDYVRERTDMMIILLHSALLLLVKDNDRYVLRTFKATREHAGGGGGSSGVSTVSDRTTSMSTTGSLAERTSLSSSSFSGSAACTFHPNAPHTGSLGSFSGAAALSQPNTVSGATGSGLVTAVASMAGASISERPSGSGSLKLAPILLLNNLFTSRGEQLKNEHLLNIVSMDPPVLVRVLFFQKEQREKWYALLKERSPMEQLLISAQQQQRNALAVSMTKSATPSQMLSLRNNRADRSSGVSEAESVKPTSAEAVSTQEEEAVTSEETIEPGDLISQDEFPRSQPTVIEQSDSTSSIDEEMNTMDRVHMSISACNRMNLQIRRDLCETLRISDADYAKICKTLPLDEPPTLDQLLLLQVDIMNNWLQFLSHTYAMAMRRRELSSTLRAQPEDDVGHSGDVKLLPESGKRPSLFSLVESFRTSQQVYNPASDANGSQQDNSQLNKPLASSVPNVDQVSSCPFTTARLHGVSVHDSRRSRRRAVRSSSLIEREAANVPDRFSMVQMWKLVSQMANTIRQFNKLTTEEQHLLEPLRRSISDPDTPISSRFPSIRHEKEQLNKGSTEVLFPDQGTNGKTEPEVSEYKEVENVPQDPDNTDKETLVISNQLPPDVLQTENIPCPDSELLTKSSIRDSGCLPSATDEDDEAQSVSEDVFLDPMQHCSTPTEDGEQQRTPTANIEMLDLSTSEEPVEAEAVEPDKLCPILDGEQKSDSGFDADGQTESLQPKPTSAEILVARNDSQKSTTSSGFVED